MNSIAQKTRTRGRTYRVLRSEMQKRGMTHKDLAKALHISNSAVNARMAGHQPWSVDQAYQVLDIMHLSKRYFSTYFPQDPWEDPREDSWDAEVTS